MTADQARLRPRDVAVWAASVIFGQTVGFAVLLALVGVALGIPLGHLVVPFVLFFWCALLTPGLYLWVRAARGRQAAWAWRNAVVCLVYSQIVALALALSAIRLGLIGEQALLSWYTPTALVCLIGVSGAVYVKLRNVTPE